MGTDPAKCYDFYRGQTLRKVMGTDPTKWKVIKPWGQALKRVASSMGTDPEKQEVE